MKHLTAQIKVIQYKFIELTTYLRYKTPNLKFFHRTFFSVKLFQVTKIQKKIAQRFSGKISF